MGVGERVLAVVATGAALLSMTACSKDAEPATKTVVETVTEAPASSDQPTQAPASTTSSQTDGPKNDAATPTDYEVDGNFYFSSPSGKFYCGIVVSMGTAGCQGDLPDNAPKQPAAGAPDNLIPPNTVLVGVSGQGEFASFGDPAFSPQDRQSGKTLPYDTPLSAAGFTCSVTASTGVTCRNDASGSGFTVSSSDYQLF